MPGSRRVYAVHAACIRGVEAFPVTVEVSASGTIPGLTIVGMAESQTIEPAHLMEASLLQGRRGDGEAC